LSGSLPPINLQSSQDGGFPLKEYLEMALRRKWWIILAAIALFVGATVIALRTPNVYKSETVILVDPQKVPESIVASPISGTVADRLSTIRQLALSPSRLQTLAHTLKLDQKVATPKDMGRLIAKMQHSISIDVGESGGQRLSSFRISYFSGDPVQAANVANQLAAMVIHDNLSAREQQFAGTTEFLDTELKSVKDQLELKEREVQQIKSQNVADLPEMKSFHLEALNGLRNQQRVSQDRIVQLQQNRSFLQSSMTINAPTVDLDNGNTGPQASPYQSQIQKLEAKLSELQTRYGPSYPDVRKVQEEIAGLKAKSAQDGGVTRTEVQPTSGHRAIRNPVLEAELNKLDEQIAAEKKIQAGVQPQIDFHLSKLERVPIFEQKLSELTRDYETLNNQYNQTLAKKLSAGMAKTLDSQQQNERFVILDLASPATVPYSPNRPLIMMAGLLGGILGGFALAMLVEMTDQTVRSEREAAQILGKGVLAGIPLVLMPRERRAMRIRALGMITGTALGAAILTICATYFMRLVS